MTITLDVRLTAQDRAVIIRYLSDRQQLTSAEWVVLFRAFDYLATSTIESNGHKQSFGAVYSAQIEARYADTFLAQEKKMKNRLLEELSADEFDALIDNFIDQPVDEMSMSTFMATLNEIALAEGKTKEAENEVAHLLAHITAGKLRFLSPVESTAFFSVQENEIVLDDGRRIVLELA